MSTAARLALYGVALLAVFGVMFVAGRALIPDSTVADWTKEAKSDDHESMGGSEDGHESMGSGSVTENVRGLSMEQDGYTLSPVESPVKAGEPGELSFRVLDPEGRPFTDFSESHEKELHLIIVRSDGAEFRHVHPRLDRATGTWSVSWSWPTGGSYRVFADFVPATEDAPNVTLTRNVEVAGEFTPIDPEISRRDSVDGFEAALTGNLAAGRSEALAIEITRDGKPVEELQPYLGAFGHLVALREGDLAYLHVHPEGAHAEPGDLSGPEISFMAEAPTPGRYLLYLDFKVDGEVHTAEFVLEAR
ncbi:MAG: hypothetical protein J0H98_03135 [Solirubrobacterales bacterium]|nr:hypothetical protein [Solirubrobacterales bacterium]